VVEGGGRLLRAAVGQGRWQQVKGDGGGLREMVVGGRGWQQVVEGGGRSLRAVVDQGRWLWVERDGCGLREMVAGGRGWW